MRTPATAARTAGAWSTSERCVEENQPAEPMNAWLPGGRQLPSGWRLHRQRRHPAPGADVAGEAAWQLPELVDLLDEWTVAGWQNRPHEGLRHPLAPRPGAVPERHLRSPG